MNRETLTRETLAQFEERSTTIACQRGMVGKITRPDVLVVEDELCRVPNVVVGVVDDIAWGPAVTAARDGSDARR